MLQYAVADGHEVKTPLISYPGNTIPHDDAAMTACVPKDMFSRRPLDSIAARSRVEIGHFPGAAGEEPCCDFGRVLKYAREQTGVVTMCASDIAGRGRHGGGAHRHRQCSAATQDMNQRDSKETPKFQRESGSRQCLEQRNSRFRFAHMRRRLINRCSSS
jgi:hypothetical protein